MTTTSLTRPCKNCQGGIAAGLTCGCPNPEPCTLCDRDRKNNMWVERGQFPGDDARPGICLLDTMQAYQVIYSLEHNWKARHDLKRVTSDPYLHYLAENVTLLPTAELVDMEQGFLNQNFRKNSNPFYGVFAGNPPLPLPERTGDTVDDD